MNSYLFGELIDGVLHSSPQGVVGVGLIFIYFAIMMTAIVYRIKKGEHLDH